MERIFKYWNGNLPNIARLAYKSGKAKYQYKDNGLHEGCRKVANLWYRCHENLKWTETEFCKKAGYSANEFLRILRIANVSGEAYAWAAAFNLHDNEDALEHAGRVSLTSRQIYRLSEWRQGQRSEQSTPEESQYAVVSSLASRMLEEAMAEIEEADAIHETEFASDGYVVVGYIMDPDDTIEEFLGSFDTLKEAEEHARNTVANGYEEASVFHKVSKFVGERTVKKVF